jgi:hypothetical protein
MLIVLLAACDFVMSMLSTDDVIDASCAGTDTVVIDGRDICDEYEKFGRIKCDVGYRIVLDGNVVCP